MEKQKNVLVKASKKPQIIVMSIFSLFLVPSIFLLIFTSRNQSDYQKISRADTTRQKYDLFSTIPNKEKNIFKGLKLEAIFKLRESYLLGIADSSKDVLFEYEELDEVCRQAFGAIAPSWKALLKRGILTANGRHSQTGATDRRYKIYTPVKLGLESQEEIDLFKNYEDRPEFYSIEKDGDKKLSEIDQYLELYKLREYYLYNVAYISERVEFSYRQLDDVIRQAYGASSPALINLIKRGVLTAHSRYSVNDSTWTIKYKLMTPAKMGLEIGRLVNENPD